MLIRKLNNCYRILSFVKSKNIFTTIDNNTFLSGKRVNATHITLTRLQDIHTQDKMYFPLCKFLYVTENDIRIPYHYLTPQLFPSVELIVVDKQHITDLSVLHRFSKDVFLFTNIGKQMNQTILHTEIQRPLRNLRINMSYMDDEY